MKRVIEDFTCEYCEQEVTGDGYTNHCPECLWSKHVDIEPGDRAAQCGGLMEPEKLETEGTSFRITHRCTKCGYSKPNRTAKEDKLDQLLSKKAGPI